MKQLDIYVVQDAEQTSWVWVFTNKEDAIQDVKFRISTCIEEGYEVDWEWDKDGGCVISAGDPLYFMWKDDICLSDADIKKLTADDKGESA